MVHSLAFTIKNQPDVDKSTIHGWYSSSNNVKMGHWLIHKPNHLTWDRIMWSSQYQLLGGGFNYFVFSPRNLEKLCNLTCAYCSTGLVQPPTRRVWRGRSDFFPLLKHSSPRKQNYTIHRNLGQEFPERASSCEFFITVGGLKFVDPKSWIGTHRDVVHGKSLDFERSGAKIWRFPVWLVCVIGGFWLFVYSTCAFYMDSHSLHSIRLSCKVIWEKSCPHLSAHYLTNFTPGFYW